MSDYILDIPSTLTHLFIGADLFQKELRELNVLSSASAKYPPYNVKQLDDQLYAIEVALAGHSMDNIQVKTENGYLFITSKKDSNLSDHSVEDEKYLYRGIARRDFSLKFKIYENFTVENAEFKDGMLLVFLKHTVPDYLKPKFIEIKSTANRELKGK